MCEANEYAQIRSLEIPVVSEEFVNGDRSPPASLVQHRRRSLLLECLLEFNEPVSLPDLADEVAVREYENELTEIPAEEVKDIYLSLYHSHIPKLAEAGLVEYDQESDLVASTPNVELGRYVSEDRSNR